MRKNAVLIWGLLILLFIAGCGGSAQEEPNSQPAARGQVLPDFQARDLAGNPVDNRVFKDYKLSMINIWATTCGTCIDEMPDIQRVQDELQDQGVQVIGLVADLKLSAAREITQVQGVSYLNLIPDQSLLDNLVSNFDFVPVTVFVDGQGCLLGTEVSGARDYESYLSIIEDLLSPGNGQVEQGGRQ